MWRLCKAEDWSRIDPNLPKCSFSVLPKNTIVKATTNEAITNDDIMILSDDHSVVPHDLS